MELYALLDALIAEHDTDWWIERLEAAGIPCSPVQNLAQMLDHPQTQALGLVQPVPGTGMRFVGLPMSFDGVRPSPRSAPPTLGQHTGVVFPASPSFESTP